MAFCPECGKAATGEATRCAHCGHELDNKSAAAKGGGARFKGTMMMSAPAVAKPAAKPAAAAAPAPAPVAAAPAPVAAAPVAAAVAAQAPANKGLAKQTMIGTGIGPLAGAAKPAAAAPAPVARAPVAAPAPVARAPVAAPAPAPEAKRNMAFAQTQHQAAFAAVQQPRAAAPAAPAVEPLAIAATPMAPRPEPEPEPEPEPQAETESQQQYDAADDGNYLPGDPMAPHAAGPARAPMLRYDDSMPELPRINPLQDKKLLWIAAGVIGFVCLTLVVVLISKLM